MNKNTNCSRWRLLAAVFFFTILTSCGSSGADTPQKEFKKDTAYYTGLSAIDNQDEDSALRLFREGRKNCTPLAARRCAEALTLIGNVQARVEACIYLAETYKDAASLLTASKELYRDGEYARILSLTDKIDFKNDSNELIRLRLDSMIQKNDSRLEDELYTWLHERSCTSDQNAVYQAFENKRSEEFEMARQEAEKAAAEEHAQEIDELKYAPEDEKVSAVKAAAKKVQPSFPDKMTFTPKQQIMEYRINVYRKDFASSYRQISDMLELCKTNTDIPLFPQLISDMGKAALYGTETLDVAGRRFVNLANQIDSNKNTDAGIRRKNSYYAHFYAARCFDKDGSLSDQAKKQFALAMDNADDKTEYDNSLWYMLNTDLRLTSEDVIETLKKYAGSWHDPAYFDDIFDSLSVQLLSHQEWSNILTVWHTIDGHATDETTAKFAYLSGRVLEEQLADCDDGTTRKDEENAAFTRALKSGTDFYYKVLAAERLNIDDDDLQKILLTIGTPAEQDTDKNAELLLGGYAAFGFPQKVYSEWLQNRSSVSITSSANAAKFLQQCGITENRYVVQSLRIAIRAINDCGTCTTDLLGIGYPRFFEDAVQSACKENTVSEYQLYALIRSESFFDPNIVSHAGASGLTQLMNTTATDIAKKLRVSTYDMGDAYTNIRFGAYYLNDLTSRLNGSPLLALFAYNAGLTHVRGWMKAATDDYSKTGKPMHRGTGIAIDLFLETIPFSETREYGRKLISAAALYGWLYYGKSTNDVVREILN